MRDVQMRGVTHLCTTYHIRHITWGFICVRYMSHTNEPSCDMYEESDMSGYHMRIHLCTTDHIRHIIWGTYHIRQMTWGFICVRYITWGTYHIWQITWGMWYVRISHEDSFVYDRSHFSFVCDTSQRVKWGMRCVTHKWGNVAQKWDVSHTNEEFAMSYTNE